MGHECPLLAKRRFQSLSRSLVWARVEGGSCRYRTPRRLLRTAQCHIIPQPSSFLHPVEAAHAISWWEIPAGPRLRLLVSLDSGAAKLVQVIQHDCKSAHHKKRQRPKHVKTWNRLRG